MRRTEVKREEEGEGRRKWREIKWGRVIERDKRVRGGWGRGREIEKRKRESSWALHILYRATDGCDSRTKTGFTEYPVLNNSSISVLTSLSDSEQTDSRCKALPRHLFTSFFLLRKTISRWKLDLLFFHQLLHQNFHRKVWNKFWPSLNFEPIQVKAGKIELN